jgi:hypothetical protein
MKTTVYENEFIKMFQDIRPNNFSIGGLRRLYEGLTEFEQDTGEEIELDVIAICCDFQEMTMKEIIDAYDYMMDESRLDDDDAYSYVMDWLNNQTWVLGDTESGSIIFREF